jgi:hypothetical protein
MMYEFAGTTPKTLGVFAIFGFDRASRQLRRTSEGADASRRLSGWCGSRDLLYLGEVSAEAKAVGLGVRS